MDVTDSLSIPDEELSFSFARSGGPGGQNVNKVASKVQVRWAIDLNATVPLDAKERLRRLHPSKVTNDGGFLITAQESRDQVRNKEIAIEKLVELIRIALVRPKTRHQTKPTRSSKLRRLSDKKATSQRKANRNVSQSD